LEAAMVSWLEKFDRREAAAREEFEPAAWPLVHLGLGVSSVCPYREGREQQQGHHSGERGHDI